jgi:hypothetical protein
VRFTYKELCKLYLSTNDLTCNIELTAAAHDTVFPVLVVGARGDREDDTR